MNSKGVWAFVVAFATGAAAVASISSATAETKKEATSPTALRVPKDYRSNYEFLGVWAVSADSGPGSKELHQVYASPGAAAAYKRTGDWADGSTLVKEVYEAQTAPMTTGQVSRVNKLKGWFVMEKDAKNSHGQNPLWGDGWGWSWFDSKDPTKTTTVDYRQECLTCHVPAKATDWIYVQGYPSLK